MCGLCRNFEQRLERAVGDTLHKLDCLNTRRPANTTTPPLLTAYAWLSVFSNDSPLLTQQQSRLWCTGSIGSPQERDGSVSHETTRGCATLGINLIWCSVSPQFTNGALNLDWCLWETKNFMPNISSFPILVTVNRRVYQLSRGLPCSSCHLPRRSPQRIGSGPKLVISH